MPFIDYLSSRLVFGPLRFSWFYRKNSATQGWYDNFSALDLEPVTAAPNRWATYFKKWGQRYLSGNSDDAWKTHDERIESGRTRTMQQVLQQATSPSWPAKTRYLHEVSNGTIKLRTYPVAVADQVDTNNFPYISGMISSEAMPSLAKSRGYWVTRLKYNSITKGHHFSIWLVPADDGTWFELDILESVNSNTYWTCNSHGEDPAVAQTEYRPKKPTDWHTVAFEWTDSTMTWYFDDVIVRRHPNYISAGRLAHYLASWECAGTWAGDPDGTTVWPSEVELDNVRYYASKPTVTRTEWAYTGAGPLAWAKGTTPLTLTEAAHTQPGDLQVAAIAFRGNVPFTAPSGWSIAVQDTRGNSSYFGTGYNVASVAVLWRVRGVGAPGSITFNKGAGTIDALDIYQGQILNFVGPGTKSIVGAQANVDTERTSAAVVVPSITTQANDLCVMVGATSNSLTLSSLASSTGPATNTSAANGIGNIAAGDAWGVTNTGSTFAWNDPSLVTALSVGHSVSSGGALGNTTVTFSGANGHAGAVAVFRAT